MPVRQDNLKLLPASGLLPANPGAEMRARLQPLPAKEVQGLTGTRPRIALDQCKCDHGFLAI